MMMMSRARVRYLGAGVQITRAHLNAQYRHKSSNSFNLLNSLSLLSSSLRHHRCLHQHQNHDTHNLSHHYRFFNQAATENNNANSAANNENDDDDYDHDHEQTTEQKKQRLSENIDPALYIGGNLTKSSQLMATLSYSGNFKLLRHLSAEILLNTPDHPLALRCNRAALKKIDYVIAMCMGCISTPAMFPISVRFIVRHPVHKYGVVELDGETISNAVDLIIFINCEKGKVQEQPLLPSTYDHTNASDNNMTEHTLHSVSTSRHNANKHEDLDKVIFACAPIWLVDPSSLNLIHALVDRSAHAHLFRSIMTSERGVLPFSEFFQTMKTSLHAALEPPKPSLEYTVRKQRLEKPVSRGIGKEEGAEGKGKGEGEDDFSVNLQVYNLMIDATVFERGAGTLLTVVENMKRASIQAFATSAPTTPETTTTNAPLLPIYTRNPLSSKHLHLLSSISFFVTHFRDPEVKYYDGRYGIMIVEANLNEYQMYHCVMHALKMAQKKNLPFGFDHFYMTGRRLYYRYLVCRDLANLFSVAQVHGHLNISEDELYVFYAEVHKAMTDDQSLFRYPLLSSTLVKDENGAQIAHTPIATGVVISDDYEEAKQDKSLRTQYELDKLKMPKRNLHFINCTVSIERYNMSSPRSIVLDPIIEKVLFVYGHPLHSLALLHSFLRERALYQNSRIPRNKDERVKHSQIKKSIFEFKNTQLQKQKQREQPEEEKIGERLLG